MIKDVLVLYLVFSVIELVISVASLHLIFKYYLHITWKDFFSRLLKS